MDRTIAGAAPALPWAGLGLALAGSIAFSGKAIIIKLAYRHGVDPITLIMLRMLLALPLFAALSWWAGRGKAPLSAHDKRMVFLLGFCGYYLASLLDFLGLQYLSAGLGRLILYLTPTVVLLLGAVFFKRPVGWRQMLALTVGYAGALLVFGHELHAQGAQVALGAALVFGSMLCYAVYLLFSGEVVQRVGSLRLTGLATSVACVLCIVHWWVTMPWASVQAVVPAVWWLSALNATLCTFAPVLLTMMAIERIGAALAAQAGMIGPLSTIALSIVLLGEPFTPWLAAGTVCVLAGVWLLARWR